MELTDKFMTIHFKNGKTKEIPKWMAQCLKERLHIGCEDWQTFQENTGDLVLFIKLSEITHID